MILSSFRFLTFQIEDDRAWNLKRDTKILSQETYSLSPKAPERHMTVRQKKTLGSNSFTSVTYCLRGALWPWPPCASRV